ncbi:hypothetical protein HY837_03125 [archaeon]|nr:hypothetical protein [archaeon]
MSLKQKLLSHTGVVEALDNYTKLNEDNVEDLSEKLKNAYVEGANEFFTGMYKYNKARAKSMTWKAWAFGGLTLTACALGLDKFGSGQEVSYLSPVYVGTWLTLLTGFLTARHCVIRDTSEAHLKQLGKETYKSELQEHLTSLAQETLEERFGVSLELRKEERAALTELVTGYLESNPKGEGREELTYFVNGVNTFFNKYRPTVQEKVVVTKLVNYALDNGKKLPKDAAKQLNRVFKRLTGNDHPKYEEKK